jgi:hypothetical protein
MTAYTRCFSRCMTIAALWLGGAGAASAQLGNASALISCSTAQSSGSGLDTAYGGSALPFNGGSNNSAFGVAALFLDGNEYSGPVGSNNTAVGVYSLYYNNGSCNSAYGTAALANNSSGSYNTAVGVSAMYGYQAASTFQEHGGEIGDYNAAIGFQSLFNYSGAARNTAVGTSTLYADINGNLNTAVGYAALFNNTGDYNIAIGGEAGYSLKSGSNNIYIAHPGEPTESGVTRIGAPGTQTAVYIAGIESAKVTGSAVYVTSSGQLGVQASSERYKTDVSPIGTGTERLRQLRPVSFHLKTDPLGALQYGLIAEEVAKVYPELVIRDEGGKIQGVHYEELAPMLLNEVQRQGVEIRNLKQQVAELKELRQDMRAALTLLPAEDRRVAQR